MALIWSLVMEQLATNASVRTAYEQYLLENTIVRIPVENHRGRVWTPPQFGSDEAAKTFNWLLFKKAAVGFMSAG